MLFPSNKERSFGFREIGPCWSSFLSQISFQNIKAVFAMLNCRLYLILHFRYYTIDGIFCNSEPQSDKQQKIKHLLMIRDYSYLFKVVLVGNSAVGKSSLLRRFADDAFQESYLATIGVDFRFKSIMISEDVVKLQIWDTAGQQRFRTITGAYYKGAHAIVLVYDITRPDTFSDFDDFWLDEIQKFAVPNVKIFVLGNKSDQSQNRKVSEEEATNFCRSKNIGWKEVSAKNGEKVSEAFYQIAEQLTKIYPKQQEKKKKSAKKDVQKKKRQIHLEDGTNPTKNNSSCCKS